MKIKLINPMKGNQEFFAGYCAQYWNDVDVESLDEAPHTIYNRFDVAWVGQEMMKKVQKAEKEGYDAVLFTCHADPNLSAAREGTHIPVLGLMQTTAHIASMMGHRFTVLSPGDAIKKWQEENIAKYGLTNRMASVRSVKAKETLPAEEVVKIGGKKPWPKAVEALIDRWADEAVKAAAEDESDVIFFGCGLYVYIHDEIIKRAKDRGCDALILKPLHVTVEVARALVNLGISHSPVAYPYLEIV